MSTTRDMETASKENYEALEGMVDGYGLSGVLKALANVCEEKAEHIELNWQDRHFAKLWMRAAKRVHAVAKSTAVKAIP